MMPGPPPDAPGNPPRDALRSEMLTTAAAACPAAEPVLVCDTGPLGVGTLMGGPARTASSRLRVEVGLPAHPANQADRPDGDTDSDTDRRGAAGLAAARRRLAAAGWAVVRSSAGPTGDELVAVRDGQTLTVSHRAGERRLVLLGETAPEQITGRG